MTYIPKTLTPLIYKQQKGFTLMELLIVMAIIAFASAVILPRITNNDSKMYQAQLKTLVATLNYNRRNAVITNRQQQAVIYPFVEEATEKNEKISKGDWRSKGADINWKSGDQEKKNQVVQLQYFPQGGATGGVLTLQHGRYQATISIDGITGKLSVEEEISEDDDS